MLFCVLLVDGLVEMLPLKVSWHLQGQSMSPHGLNHAGHLYVLPE